MTTLGIKTNPTTERLRQALEPMLTKDERIHIAGRLSFALIATGLLIAGMVYQQVFPDQHDVAQIILFIGAIVAAIPVLRTAISGLVCDCAKPSDAHAAESHCGCDHDHQVMDRLVAIAVVASIASGEILSPSSCPSSSHSVTSSRNEASSGPQPPSRVSGD